MPRDVVPMREKGVLATCICELGLCCCCGSEPFHWHDPTTAYLHPWPFVLRASCVLLASQPIQIMQQKHA